jgi:hypothetical protein
VSRGLVLVTHGSLNDRADLERIAADIRRDAPDLRVAVVRDKAQPLRRARLALRPTLTYSSTPLRHFRPLRGAVLQGSHQSKVEELETLDRAGLPVPRWKLVTRESAPDVTEFGRYVVMKPERGARGADVRIVRSTRVRFLDPYTRFAADTQRWIVQEYVYTGPWPVSHRVLTLCGTPLYAFRATADRAREPIRHGQDFADGGRNIVASHIGCTLEFCYDPDILGLAEQVAKAFEGVPLLGVDILRDADTGQLWVMEVNAGGRVWGFSSDRGTAMQQHMGGRYESQFDGLARAARVLAEQTRRLAC